MIFQWRASNTSAHDGRMAATTDRLIVTQAEALFRSDLQTGSVPRAAEIVIAIHRAVRA